MALRTSPAQLLSPQPEQNTTPESCPGVNIENAAMEYICVSFNTLPVEFAHFNLLEVSDNGKCAESSGNVRMEIEKRCLDYDNSLKFRETKLERWIFNVTVIASYRASYPRNAQIQLNCEHFVAMPDSNVSYL